jgi:hypothetical protein
MPDWERCRLSTTGGSLAQRLLFAEGAALDRAAPVWR